MLVERFQTEGQWIEAALAELRSAAASARARGSSSLALCLAGGLTPEVIYRSMASQPLEGLEVELWLGDERAVPAKDGARNGVMIERAFAGCPWAPRLRLWPEAETEEAALAACSRYEAELRSVLGNEAVFDLAFQGLGADGHTASLFPGFEPGAEAGSLAFPSLSPLPPRLRMTLSPAVLRAARRRVFLVRGGDKLSALERLEAEDPAIPASLLGGPGAIALYLS
jgi:6-phosphogluconolactonase